MMLRLMKIQSQRNEKSFRSLSGSAWILVCWLLIASSGCVNKGFQFEQITGDQTVAIPMQFDGLSGLRDGANVKVLARFSNGADNVTMNFSVFLRPPAEFQSGTYQATIAGTTKTGTVDCPSLDFQGGQTALPTVGGVFVFKDEQNRPLYRVRIPATDLKQAGRISR
jgi:hypothetical protein